MFKQERTLIRFQHCAREGYLASFNSLLQGKTLAEQQSIIADGNYYVFHEAALYGRVAIMDRLMEIAGDVQAMITSGNHRAFVYAAHGDKPAAVERLLSIHYEFAYAEIHDQEFGARWVRPFIQKKITALHVRKAAIEAAQPYAVFDVSADEALLLFYMARHLIRRNEAHYHDDLLFLFEIPAVKTLLRQEITQNQPNELLRLARQIGNQDAERLLLNIQAVRELAERDNFYSAEARGDLNLGRLAQDAESSMTALSQGEQLRLKTATEHYQSRIHAAGASHLMNELRSKLETRFKEHPAVIERDDYSSLPLPSEYSAFKSLNLSPEENQRALKAYYQHKEHTALRYLSKPNPWMHAHASYAYVNEQDPSQKWSTFEEYEPLIALLYLAALDKEIAPTEDYTLETRFEHFIDELAHIGRAHNWDQSRINAQGHDEEYDDLEGDRPSCFSGVKRRLFQSVPGHPLLAILTKEKVEAELNAFVRQHFREVIDGRYRKALSTAWDKVIMAEELIKEDEDVLKSVDISQEKQNTFLKELTKKYGSQFSDDSQFKDLIQNAFQLDSRIHNSHFLKFAHLFTPSMLLEQQDDERANPAVINSKSQSRPSLNQSEISPLESQIDTILNEFNTKIKKINRPHNNTIRTANNLYDELVRLKKEAFIKGDDVALANFATKACQAIENTIPLLQSNLSLLTFLGNMVKEIINVIAAAVVCAVTLRQQRYPGFFTITQSEAAKAATDMQTELSKELGPKP